MDAEEKMVWSKWVLGEEKGGGRAAIVGLVLVLVNVYATISMVTLIKYVAVTV